LEFEALSRFIFNIFGCPVSPGNAQVSEKVERGFVGMDREVEKADNVVGEMT